MMRTHGRQYGREYTQACWRQARMNLLISIVFLTSKKEWAGIDRIASHQIAATASAITDEKKIRFTPVKLKA